MENENKLFSFNSHHLLLRIASDLQKELVRTKDEIVIADLQIQIETLKEAHKELEDFRTIKRILNIQ